jgi:hypothetical protein
MPIAPPSRSRSREDERPPSGDTKTRVVRARERSDVPWHERLVLAALLLVVICWIILRLLVILLASS